MIRSASTQSPERLALVRWAARIGPITAEALTAHDQSTVVSSRSRLAAAERDGLLSRSRPLARQPALYTVTRAGLRTCGLGEIEPSRVTAGNAHHAIACAAAAAALERCYPDHRLSGERELRREERECGVELASARLGGGVGDRALLHRPDLVLWPRLGARPVAVEVELTIKSPRRLGEICLAWARCRGVDGVLYLAPPEVERALVRAVEKTDAAKRVVVVPLASLPSLLELTPSANTVPDGA
jgi:hypothetical protein